MFTSLSSVPVYHASVSGCVFMCWKSVTFDICWCPPRVPP